MQKKQIRIPNYSLGEEIFNSVSHGIGALLSILALILCMVKCVVCHNVLGVVTTTIYGISLILLYTISCIYHSLSPKLRGKGVLRVIDHCNVHFLVLGTYIPVAILSIGGVYGIVLLSVVATFCILGIIFSAIDVDKYSLISVICHLVSGWSLLFATSSIIENSGIVSFVYLILGGVMYTIGSILYWKGSRIKYMHSVFHIFCLLGSLFHFLSIYLYIL